MADQPRPFAEDASHKIMKIAELTADPAKTAGAESRL